MAIHVAPSSACDKGCDYCYEEPAREVDKETFKNDYDVDAIIERLKEFKETHPNTNPGLHGGEPTLMKVEDMERIYKFIDENWEGGSHIQTHGANITDEHIRIFKKYNVGVGISIDGPKELNRLRKSRGGGGEDRTDKETRQTLNNIWRLIEHDIVPGIIVVLHEQNAGTDEKLEKLLKWIDRLCKDGVRGHFNPALSYKDVDNDVSLSPSRLAEVYERCIEWMYEEDYRVWGPFDDYQDNLMGLKRGNCVQNKCDPYNAGAAKLVRGDGETSACGKTWSIVADGVIHLAGPSSNNEYNNDDTRYEILKQTPGAVTEDEPDMGGCKGCRYWDVCTGGCPGGSMDDDWRNRSEICEAMYTAYSEVESHLRATMPNIRLITDLPWDSGAGDEAARRNLDIKPFAAMRPDQKGTSTSTGQAQHEFGSVEDVVGFDVNDPTDAGTLKEKKEKYEEEYDEDIVTVDEDSRTVHVDSAIRGNKAGELEVGDGEDEEEALLKEDDE